MKICRSTLQQKMSDFNSKHSSYRTLQRKNCFWLASNGKKSWPPRKHIAQNCSNHGRRKKLLKIARDGASLPEKVAQNCSKWHKPSRKNCSKLLEMAQASPRKLFEMTPTGPKKLLNFSQFCSKLLNFAQNCSILLKIAQNCSKLLKIAQNVSKCLEMSRNVSKCLKMSQNVSKCLKMSQEVSKGAKRSLKGCVFARARIFFYRCESWPVTMLCRMWTVGLQATVNFHFHLSVNSAV